MRNTGTQRVGFAQEYDCPVCGKIVIVRSHPADNEHADCPSCGDEVAATTGPREVKLAKKHLR